MGYPDDFRSGAFRDAMERPRSARATANEDAAAKAVEIIGRAAGELTALTGAHGPRTAEMIDEAIAWLAEQSAAIVSAAQSDAQDL